MTKRIPQTLKEVAEREMRLLCSASEADQRRVFDNATVERMLKLDAQFENWAHRNQLPPDGEGWRTWLMMAGRGFGKTRAGAEWIFRLGEARPGALIALIGATIDDARSVMVEGVSGLLSVANRNRRRLKWEPSLGRLKWPNGSRAQLFSGDNGDGLRGPEHNFAWCIAIARRAGCGGGRKLAAKRATAGALGWQLLHRRIGADGRLGREGGTACVVECGGLALLAARRRAKRFR